MFKIDLPGDGFEMAVLGCRSLVLVIIIIINNSQMTRNFHYCYIKNIQL